MAERHGKFVRVQVKESRVYDNVANPEIRWSSWTQLAPDSLRKAAAQGVDSFVFVVYGLNERGHKLRFDVFYVVIAPDDLEKRLRVYHAERDRAVYWHRDNEGHLWEVRGKTGRTAGSSFRTPERNFTTYLNNWDT